MEKITQKLFELKDESYAIFQKKLIPNVDVKIIGVRVPDIRNVSKSLNDEEKEAFLKELPHKYYDENILHCILISNMKEYDKIIYHIEKFLPYIDNWAVNDMLSPKIFKKNTNSLIEKIKIWIKSEKTYTVRFAITTLLSYYLDDAFEKEHIKLVSSIKTEEYYINMAIAWYISAALVKQYDDTIKIIEDKKMDKFVHNKSIQKAIESYRISDERKKYLKTLRK